LPASAFAEWWFTLFCQYLPHIYSCNFDYLLFLTLRNIFTANNHLYKRSESYSIKPAQGIAAEILLVAESLEAPKDCSEKPGPLGARPYSDTFCSQKVSKKLMIL
jgi:hypothetical protein